MADMRIEVPRISRIKNLVAVGYAVTVRVGEPRDGVVCEDLGVV